MPVEKASFTFVEDDVRLHLAHLPTSQIADIVQWLRLFEGNVFETRTQPRPPPVWLFDVPIVERPGSLPPARRSSGNSASSARIGSLGSMSVGRRPHSPQSCSEYSAPALFTPTQDGKLRMVVDYRMLNAQTVRDRNRT